MLAALRALGAGATIFGIGAIIGYAHETARVNKVAAQVARAIHLKKEA